MTWLFGQFWILLLIAFLVGALVTYVVEKALLPHVDEVGGTIEKAVL
ncbi:hypothetical protein [Nocardioides cavernaquae]|nr:hypothetical protein [Nocardioides cavernaquae]